MNNLYTLSLFISKVWKCLLLISWERWTGEIHLDCIGLWKLADWKTGVCVWILITDTIYMHSIYKSSFVQILMKEEVTNDGVVRAGVGDMKYTVMIWRSWVRTFGRTLGALYFFPNHISTKNIIWKRNYTHIVETCYE